MMNGSIGMPQAFARCNCIPYKLFDLFYFCKTAILFPVKYLFITNADIVTATYFAWLQGNCPRLISKSGQYLLRHICRTQQPVAFWTIFNGYDWLHAKKICSLKLQQTIPNQK